ncbi:type IV secretion protein Rhs [Serratia marcescens]|uniref:type IV secretion protein Rhs n=1 Tax=Serratia marcescens TaxID=615 RepID=UPI0018766DF8|nr:type IV secretion protein Rhs [Serratia marcescens]MBE5258383.1 type IV secretion protein Rhs [Serratia marcescens]MBE5299484.1 type IV secretion protein Rhs [Serratia marcescens]MBE5305397.1 type IV secretion protein Rhs [Serratia marcescens]
MEKKEGALRLLTSGEIGLAKSVFGGSIIYGKVWVHHDSYFPFGLQNRNTAMSPNGELYFRDWYVPDFSKEGYSHRHLFIHEMVHVWQYQRGMWVKTRGLYSWLANYSYELDGSKLLKNYAMEQQAQIVADYHLLTSSGYAVWRNRFGKEVTYSGNDYADVRTVKEKYEKVLVGFPYK